MRLFLLFMGFCLIASCSNMQRKTTDVDEQRKIYKSWVLSKCIASISTIDDEKQDALNSASAYLEISRLPVDSFSNAKPLIDEFLARKYQGSIAGTFNTKKCVDLLYSDELEKLFFTEYKNNK